MLFRKYRTPKLAPVNAQAATHPDRRRRPVFAPLQKPGVRLTARPLSVALYRVDKSSERSNRATERSPT